MNTIKFYFLLIAIILLLLATLNAQISQGGLPYSFTHTVGDSIPTITLPPVNVDSLLQADAADTTLRPFRSGIGLDVNINLYNSGIWETQSDGSGLWRLRIVSSGAQTLGLIYDEFQIESGTKYYLYSDDSTKIKGAYTDLNNSNQRFITPEIYSDIIILEFWEPITYTDSSSISINKIIYG